VEEAWEQCKAVASEYTAEGAREQRKVVRVDCRTVAAVCKAAMVAYRIVAEGCKAVKVAYRMVTWVGKAVEKSLCMDRLLATTSHVLWRAL
jgi:hypothetical protein